MDAGSTHGMRLLVLADGQGVVQGAALLDESQGSGKTPTLIGLRDPDGHGAHEVLLPQELQGREFVANALEGYRVVIDNGNATLRALTP